ncbi:MAG: hypothetical protein IT260_21230 [Saprospiraceae bacterium]|nr:hypothetical protein [Saprospiraceae bacterium]
MPGTENNQPSGLQQELEQLKAQHLLSPADQRRKLIRWGVRQALTLLLYFYCWDKHPWVPLSLWLVVPLALASLISIVGFNWLLERKFRKSGLAIKEMEDRIGSPQEDE